jgi:RNA polymerase sigma-70 factor (ECF subfamily)
MTCGATRDSAPRATYDGGAMTRNVPDEAPVSSVGAPARDEVDSAFHALRPELLRFAFWLARDRSIAEDVVQEALLRAWRSRAELKDEAALRSWLLTIVRREHARLYERKRLEMTNLTHTMENDASFSAPDGDGELRELRLAILRLPDAYREPLVMQVFGGFTAEEIGRELAVSTSAVLTRLCRARRKLRAAYGLAPAPEDDSIAENDDELR